MVCPYSIAARGGVQAHVLGLARGLRGLGHQVEVLAPAAAGDPVPEFVTPAGRAVGVPYNGSVAPLAFGTDEGTINGTFTVTASRSVNASGPTTTLRPSFTYGIAVA